MQAFSQLMFLSILSCFFVIIKSKFRK